MPGSANLNTMIKAARRAGRSLVKDFKEVENLQVSRKGAGDFVSRADTAAEGIIREILTEARPTYGWLGEETGGSDGEDPTRRWIVDPLDGTTNFLHGLPHWAVSIALEHKGKVISGVIFDAAKDELFYAEKGAGAWMNGPSMNDERLRVSSRSQVSDSLYATGIPFADTVVDLPSTTQQLKNLMPFCAGVRRLGSAALDLAYVAAGRYDGYWERGLQSWDIAAGVIIAREAGALVESLDDSTVEPHELGNVICANDAQFNEFVRIIKQ